MRAYLVIPGDGMQVPRRVAVILRRAGTGATFSRTFIGRRVHDMATVAAGVSGHGDGEAAGERATGSRLRRRGPASPPGWTVRPSKIDGGSCSRLGALSHAPLSAPWRRNPVRMGRSSSRRTTAPAAAGVGGRRPHGAFLTRAPGGSGSKDVFVVGFRFSPSAGGLILHSANDGQTWSPQTSGTTDGLSAVWGTGPDDIFAVGSFGVILHSANDGALPGTASGTSGDR